MIHIAATISITWIGKLCHFAQLHMWLCFDLFGRSPIAIVGGNFDTAVAINGDAKDGVDRGKAGKSSNSIN